MSRWEGSAAMCTLLTNARAVIPTNMTIVRIPMIASVAAAFRLLGRLKFGTPLLTASNPVSAVQPEAKARSTSTATRRPPALSWARTTIMAD
jgi:hypothetical protein